METIAEVASNPASKTTQRPLLSLPKASKRPCKAAVYVPFFETAFAINVAFGITLKIYFLSISYYRKDITTSEQHGMLDTLSNNTTISLVCLLGAGCHQALASYWRYASRRKAMPS